jgi:hypothetical protein
MYFGAARWALATSSTPSTASDGPHGTLPSTMPYSSHRGSFARRDDAHASLAPSDRYRPRQVPTGR